MINFAAIDFETANGKRTSVCSVGVVIVREGKITNKIYRLIRPRPNYYTQWTTAVHGLTAILFKQTSSYLAESKIDSCPNSTTKVFSL